MIHRDAPIGEHRLEIAIADRKLQIPAHGPEDHLGREAEAPERSGGGHGQYSRNGDGRSTAPTWERCPAQCNRTGQPPLAALPGRDQRLPACLWIPGGMKRRSAREARPRPLAALYGPFILDCQIKTLEIKSKRSFDGLSHLQRDQIIAPADNPSRPI